MVPEPTMRLIGWAATRATEAIVDRVAAHIAAKAKARLVAKVRERRGIGGAA